MQVFLIRHPRPLIEPGICYGQFDVDCEDPLPIAERLRRQLPESVTIISSPLRRARRLAEALDPQARIDARLSEINFGDWEGRAWDSIERDALDAWAADMLKFIPPGGESPGQLQQRCIDFVSTLDLPSVVLVSHAGVIRSLLGYWRGLTIKEWTQIPCDFGSLTTIDVRANK